MILVVLVYAVLASTFTIAKATLSYSKPFFLIGFRMTVAGTFLLGYLFIFKKKLLHIKKPDLWLFCKVVLTHVYFAFMFEFWALSFPSISSSKTVLIYTATPFITAILAYLLLSEKLSKKKALGMFLGVAGLIPVLLLQSEPFDVGKEFLRVSFPEGILMIAVVSAAYAWFDIKKLMSKGYSLLLINGFAMFCGGLLAFTTSGIVEGFSSSPVNDWGQFLKYVFALILMSNVIFYNSYAALLKRYSITLISFTGFLTPIFGSFFGWFFLNETITWHYFVSLGVIAIALYLFHQDEISKQRG